MAQKNINNSESIDMNEFQYHFMVNVDKNREVQDLYMYTTQEINKAILLDTMNRLNPDSSEEEPSNQEKDELDSMFNIIAKRSVLNEHDLLILHSAEERNKEYIDEKLKTFSKEDYEKCLINEEILDKIFK